MSINLFMYFSFVDLNIATLHMERLTGYLASLKTAILKNKNYYLRSVLFHYTVSVA